MLDASISTDSPIHLTSISASPRITCCAGLTAFLDLSQLQQRVEPFYSHTRRPSIDPELIQARGYSATAVGAAFLPFTLVLGVLSRWSGGLVDRFGAMETGVSNGRRQLGQ